MLTPSSNGPVSNIATLIAAETLESGIISEASDRLRDAGIAAGDTEWVEQGRAVDIAFGGDLGAARTALSDLQQAVDICVQPRANRRKMLLVSDMDSTMITVECIDELADYAGIKPEISAITELAMAGELDFEEALKARVELLAGLDQNVIAACLRERVRPMPGALALVRTMVGWGAHTILVSGGFTNFAKPVAKLIGLIEVHANVLDVVDGTLTGRLSGAIVDASAKCFVLQAALAASGLTSQHAMAVGDGANDIPMIAAAVEGQGLGAGYHPRPALAKVANFSVRHNDLSALLFAQGVPKMHWIAD